MGHCLAYRFACEKMSRVINTDNILDSKRTRKQKQTWEPEDPRLTKKTRKDDGKHSHKKKERNRNEAASGEASNRWHDYKQLIKRFVSGLLKEEHYLELYSQSQNLKEGDMELKRIQGKVKSWKKAIVSTMKAIESENQEHKRWPELGEADEENMVEVSHILCSACNGEETDDNDILFCDREGCFRAYHQLCLQPPITLQDFDPEQDWFCWQCECLDDCLDLISERLGEEHITVDSLFPEVQRENDAEAAAADTLAGVVLGEDDDDSDDEEYNPSADEVAAEGEELDDASAGNSDNVEDDNETEIGDEYREQGNEPSKNNDNESFLLDRLQAISTPIQSGDIDEDRLDNDDDDDSDDDEDRESDIDSNLGEDEIAGLLEDAGSDVNYLSMLQSQQQSAGDDGGGYRGRLRDRSKRSAAQTIHVFGAEDVGRDVARVRRGVFVTGTVTAFALSDESTIALSESTTLPESTDNAETEALGDDAAQAAATTSQHSTVNDIDLIEQKGRWTVIFRDGVVREQLTASELRKALELAREYVQRQESLSAGAANSALQSTISALVHSSGQLDEDNVLDHKREKKSIDYVALSLQMFGTLYDDDDERILDDNREEDLETEAKVHRLLNIQKSSSSFKRKQRTAGGNEDDEDLDVDPLGLSMAVDRDEDYREKKTRKRKSSVTTREENGNTIQKRKRRTKAEMAADRASNNSSVQKPIVKKNGGLPSSLSVGKPAQVEAHDTTDHKPVANTN